MSNNFVEYFENNLCRQIKKLDNCNISHREIVVVVGQGYTVDFIRNELYKSCKKLELKKQTINFGFDFGFNNGTKIFAITRRYKERYCSMRVYLRRADKMDLRELCPDVIVVYGSFLAEQMQQTFEFIQRNSYKKDLEVKFLNR